MYNLRYGMYKLFDTSRVYSYVFQRVILPITFTWYNGSLRKNCFNQGYCKSINKDKVLFSTNCVLASYLSDFTHKVTNCCKQGLTSCVISLIPNFLAGFVKKMYLTKIKLFSVTSVNFGFILNVTILII